MKFSPSPNFDNRAFGVALDYIVLHYTGMNDAASAQARLCDPAARVSAHYLIEENGDLTQLVDETRRAWHAGQSFWRGATDLNSASIGIELINPGHEFGYRPFPEPQLEALKKLLREIIARHHMNPATALLAHSDIAPTRKQDPGELFPWQDLAQEGFGLWPAPLPSDYAPADAQEIDALLAFIGYDTTSPQDSLRAFQRRYRPKNLAGISDNETTAILRALKRFIVTNCAFS
ncbi:MAG: N-acetylmuramoyl-L-alanine amidase [Alphaproteobacteria bacterium]|nr:N-acetylmuramoyl-L-alanine amidase [Alphaproteobacteria bacterium]